MCTKILSLFATIALLCPILSILASSVMVDRDAVNTTVTSKFKQVQDVIKIINEDTVDRVAYECDFLHNGEATEIPYQRTVETSQVRKYSASYWLCCRFVRFNSKRYQPPREPKLPYDPYMGVAFVEKGAKTTNIYLRENGIYVATDGVSRENAKQLAKWISRCNKNYTVCPNPKTKWLNSDEGTVCISECRKIDSDSPHQCIVHGSKSGLKNCTPRSDYNIRIYGKNNTVTSRGVPCNTDCKRAPGADYNSCETRRHPVLAHTRTGLPPWDYCSAIPGHDYYGRKCAGDCWYHGYEYKWCWVVGGSWGYCS